MIEYRADALATKTVEELENEIVRLKDCLKAYETAEHKVLRLEWKPMEGSVFPGIIITAPGMNEAEIGKYCMDVYFLYAETLKATWEMEKRREADNV